MNGFYQIRDEIDEIDISFSQTYDLRPNFIEKSFIYSDSIQIFQQQ